MKKIITKGEDFFTLIFGLGVLASLYLMSLYHYLLFHTVAESFSIVIASAIFLVAWHTRYIAGNNFLLFIGNAYVFIAFIDTLHTLAYTGMEIIKGYGTNLPTELWITGRYFESLTLLIAPFFIRKKLNTRLQFIIYGLLTAFILASIFYWRIFPDCFIDGKGLTPFKKISEYIISFILIVSILIIHRKRDVLGKDLVWLMIASIATKILSELAFTFYIHAYGFSNLMGHFLKIASFFFLYRAIIVTCLEKPYKSIFKDLHEKEEGLETLVDQRTADLQKSRSSLAEAQRIAHLGNWDWDIVNNNLQWSDEIYRIFGLEPQQFGATYEAFLNCVHTDDRDFVTNSVNAALNENKEYSIDHRIILPDGSEKVVHEEAKVFRNDKGQAIQMIGTLQDITEREKVKEQLQRNYETLTVVNSVMEFSLKNITIEEVFEHTIKMIVTVSSFSFESKGGIFTVEGDPEALVMKAQFGLEEQIINLCKELPIGKCLCGKAALEKKVQFVEHLDERHEIRYDGISDHGHYCVPILFGEKTLGVINVYTQEGHLYNKKDEEFLTTIANTLAGIIVRRYSEKEKLVLEDKLRQSQQMRMMGQLTSGVAHEVRNPLNSIIAITEALFKEIGDNTEFQEYLEHIRKQVDRLSNLMQDLLDFGRPGKKSDLQPISIGSVIFDTVNSWKHASVYKKHKVRIVESPGIREWYINADKDRIQQVFYNLIDNSCDHSPEEQDILISVDRGEDSNLLVKVADKGGGVSPEHLPNIFDPFFTTRKKGMGLGLSIVKNIIELHGGNIAAYNNDPSPGLTVEISLPLVDNNRNKV